MFVVFDIETTGLSTTYSDIVQFAYCLFDHSNQFVKAGNLYFYYDGMSWSQEAADASHHLTVDFLKQYADEFEPNLLRMYSMLNRNNVIGHNSDHFDCPFVKNWLARRGLVDFEFGIQQDTMKAFKPITKRSRIKLTKLAEMLGITDAIVQYFAELWFGKEQLRGPHDAAYDVVMTALVTLQGLKKNLIAFNAIRVDDIVTEETFEDYADDSFEEKDFDPNTYIVRLVELNGDTRYHYMNHDATKYACYDDPTEETIGQCSQQHRFLDVPLSPSGGGSYTGSKNGIVFTYSRENNCDYMHIHTPYINDSDSKMPILKIIDNLMQGGV